MTAAGVGEESLVEQSRSELDSKRTGSIYSINVSKGGVPKKAVTVAQVTEYCVVGDEQNDRRYHGGPERAVCLYSQELIEALRVEGHPIGTGTIGENVTVRGVDWNLVMPGVRVVLGNSVLLQITSFTKPCKTIRASFRDGAFVRISQKLHPGWSRVYARVLKQGEIRTGDAVRVLRPTA
jgi:MOSC domain-containing protein YiiM